MKKVFVLLLLLGVAGSASALDSLWAPAGGSTEWNVEGNWTAGIPYANPANELDVLNEQAKIAGIQGVTAFPEIKTGDNVTAYRVMVANGTSPVYGELTISGGILNTLGYMTAANNSSDTAVINMEGGTVNVGMVNGVLNGNNGHFYMGRNGTTTFNMSGGNFNIARDLNVAQYAIATSTINLSGGTLSAMTLKRTGTAHIDISGTGKLVLSNATSVATVQTWIDNGWLTVNGADTDYSVISFDSGTGLTTVTPEPATLCLLGLGALSLIRRK